MSVFFSPAFAPGSGRSYDIFWDSTQAAIIPNSTVVVATCSARGGVQPLPSVFWSLTNTTDRSTFEIVNGQVVGVFGHGASGSQAAEFKRSVPWAVTQVGLGGSGAIESLQQMVFEIDVIAKSGAASGAPNNFGSVFGAQFGSLLGVSTPGVGLTQAGAGWALLGNQWVCYGSGSGGASAPPTVLATPNNNALVMHTLALQFIQPSSSQPPACQWWLDGAKVLTLDMSRAPFPLGVGGQTEWGVGLTATPILGLLAPFGIRGARMIGGPLSASVYPV